MKRFLIFTAFVLFGVFTICLYGAYVPVKKISSPSGKQQLFVYVRSRKIYIEIVANNHSTQYACYTGASALSGWNAEWKNDEFIILTSSDIGTRYLVRQNSEWQIINPLYSESPRGTYLLHGRIKGELLLMKVVLLAKHTPVGKAEEKIQDKNVYLHWLSDSMFELVVNGKPKQAFQIRNGFIVRAAGGSPENLNPAGGVSAAVDFYKAQPEEQKPDTDPNHPAQ